MAGFDAIAGGLLSGLGTGMVAQAQARREAALLRAAQLREERLLGEEREFQLQRDQDTRDFERQQAEAERKHEGGLLSTTKTDEAGKVYGITKNLGVKDLGIKEALEEDEDGSGGSGGGLSSSDRSLVERISNNYWAKLNAEGQFIVMEDSRDNYTLTMKRTGELMGKGVPLFQATNLAALSISGPLSEEEARKVAEKEAHQKFGGWTQGAQREQYIASRTPELMEQSRTAEREYQRLVGGNANTGGGLLGGAGTAAPGAQAQPTGTAAAPSQAKPQAQPKAQAQSGQKASKAPPGAGTRADPYQATTQADIDWFIQNAPAGAVIKADGKLYTK